MEGKKNPFIEIEDKNMKEERAFKFAGPERFF